MKLTFYRNPKGSNFGDELNTFIWPKLLHGVFDQDERTLFIGIGSILHGHYAPESRKIVMGAGYGAYDTPPSLDASWDVYFVRGPQTAKCLGLPESASVTDGAVLIRTLDLERPVKRYRASYIPHWESLLFGHWQDACRLAGLHLIDPRWPVEEVLAQIQQSEVIVTEAMHGAIVADTLRVPWVPMLPIAPAHRFKWTDWAESLRLAYRPRRLLPSSGWEVDVLFPQLRLTHLRHDARASARPAVPASERAGERIRGVVGRTLTALAAASLWRASHSEPTLSCDRVLDAVTSQAVGCVDRFLRSLC